MLDKARTAHVFWHRAKHYNMAALPESSFTRSIKLAVQAALDGVHNDVVQVRRYAYKNGGIAHWCDKDEAFLQSLVELGHKFLRFSLRWRSEKVQITELLNVALNVGCDMCEGATLAPLTYKNKVAQTCNSGCCGMNITSSQSSSPPAGVAPIFSSSPHFMGILRAQIPLHIVQRGRNLEPLFAWLTSNLPKIHLSLRLK